MLAEHRWCLAREKAGQTYQKPAVIVAARDGGDG